MNIYAEAFTGAPAIEDIACGKGGFSCKAAVLREHPEWAYLVTGGDPPARQSIGNDDDSLIPEAAGDAA